MNNSLTELRHRLHREPELSGKERRTAEILLEYLRRQQPDRLLTGIGGNGIIAVYKGVEDGGEILLRCDMDAVPVQEELNEPHRSIHPGVSHNCGHDGHMAIMAGVARELARSRPGKGTVLLLFQPGEETGTGAELVLEDMAFRNFHPKMVFALHNLPGFPLGSIITLAGPFAQASRGLIVRLRGRSSHAGEPLLGRSPAPAVASLIREFEDLCRHEDGIIVTLIHAVIGEVAFGTSPERAVVMATLRAPTVPLMDELSSRVISLVTETASSHGLDLETEWTEEFPPTVNSAQADSMVRSAAGILELELIEPEKLFPWSEDFGHFTERFGGALFGLGAGITTPSLHDPAYEFPDGLIGTGGAMFMKLIERIAGFEP